MQTFNTQVNRKKIVQAPFKEDFGIILDKPTYPSYSSLDSRIRSYTSNWQTGNAPSIEELSKAGFAYTGVDDAVRCYFCGGGIRNWQLHHSPWKQHALQFPTCGHLRQCKGDNFIKTVRGDIVKHSDSCEDLCNEFSDENDSSLVLTLDSLDRVSAAMKNNSVSVSAVREFVSDETKIRNGISYLLKTDIVHFSAIELLTAVEESESSDVSVIQTEDEQIEMETLQNENSQLREPVSCKICMDAVASIIALPCGHLFSCPQCIAPLSKCAICRTEIKGTVRVSLCTFNKESIE